MDNPDTIYELRKDITTPNGYIRAGKRKSKAEWLKDYPNAFEWNSKEMYMLLCQRGTITTFLTFINNEPHRAEEWLNYNIKSNKDSLIGCNYLNTSSNELANLAAKYEALAKSEMIGELQLLLEIVKSDT